MIKENSPMSSALCQSNGYRQLCSLWFEYDLCLNRKPPNDLKICLTTLIRIRPTSVPKGVKLRFKYDQRKLPMSSALCQSNGYRQLCSLWFKYDLCLNRKPPSDHINFGITPIKRVSTAMLDEQVRESWIRAFSDSRTISLGRTVGL